MSSMADLVSTLWPTRIHYISQHFEKLSMSRQRQRSYEHTCLCLGLIILEEIACETPSFLAIIGDVGSSMMV